MLQCGAWFGFGMRRGRGRDEKGWAGRIDGPTRSCLNVGLGLMADDGMEMGQVVLSEAVLREYT